MNRKTKIASLISMLLLLMFSMPNGNIGVTNVSAGGYCDWLSFVADVTIPDGLPVDPGIALKKTWRLKNVGTCTWSKSYKLVFVGGEQMGGVSAVNLPQYVDSGQTIDLTLGLTAPTAPGRYIGYWELQNATGGLFGFGQAANKPFWVEIEVVGKSAPVFDFVANAPLTNWRTEAAGKRPFPGVYGDPNGWVLKVDRPILENGIASTSPGIMMAPPPADYGEPIFGIFPSYTVKPGDRFQAIVGCEYGSTGCDLTFVLQYRIENPNVTTRTFWSLTKYYKNSFTRVNLNLNPLAGQKVSFVLMIRSNGGTRSDHAIWANPVIVNSLVPGPAIPTVTPQPDITAVPTISTLPPGTGCDRATFVSDVTVPDGTDFTPGQAFTKTWRFRNTGTCTWTTDYSLVFSSGDQMSGPAINLPSSVAPGQTIDLSVNLTAPSNVGTYRGYWLLKNTAGNLFGIGVRADKPFWLAIDVVGTLPPNPAGYDFVAHACEAQWASGVGALPCPDQSDTDGTILIVNNPRLENNTVDPRPALLTVPQNIFNGYIQGTYPAFTVQAGDHFQSIVDCEYLQRYCYVAFRLDYRINNGPIQNLWAFGERYDGRYYQADVDLSSLAGQNVQFILRVNANGSPTGDRAMWVAPSIVRNSVPATIAPTMTTTPPAATATVGSTQTTTAITAVPSETLTLTPTLTATLAPVNPSQLTYTNQKYGFQFTYPANSVVTTSQDAFAHINLPFTSGTNLIEKYLEVTVAENTSTCTSPLTSGHTPGSFSSQNVTTTTGLQFLKESGQDVAVGQIYDWVAYSIAKGTTCVSLNFVLHSNSFGSPVYNKDLESAVFLDTVSSFSWTAP